MNTQGDFGQFTELMKRVIPRKQEEKPISSSRVPAV